MRCDGFDVEMAKAEAQSFPEADNGKQLLKQDQAGKGGQLLVLETQCWQMLGFMNGVGFATLHRERSPFAVVGWVCTSNSIANGRPLFVSCHFLT